MSARLREVDTMSAAIIGWALMLLIGACGDETASAPPDAGQKTDVTQPAVGSLKEVPIAPSEALLTAIAAARVVDRVPPDTVLTLIVGLPVRDQIAVRDAVRSVSDPKSSSYRHYISPAVFGERFGAPEDDYGAVQRWLTLAHLTVEPHPNRIALEVRGTVGDIEKAFQVQLKYFLRPDGTQFRAPNRAPLVPSSLAISTIENLQDYVRTDPRGGSNGSGYNGSLKAADLRAAYLSCIPTSLTGSGQYVGLCEPNNVCVQWRDIVNYISTNNLTNYLGGSAVPTPSWINMPNGAYCPDGGGTVSSEMTLDIEMVLALAPGAQIYVAGGTGEASLFEFSENTILTTNSCSYGLGSLDSTGQNLIDEMALQGQSLFVTSGDGGPYTTTNDGTQNLSYFAEQAVTVVGGTVLTMADAGATKSYGSEQAWPQSGGGPQSNPGQNPPMEIPPYQIPLVNAASAGAGVSTTIRNVPDISMPAQGVDLQYLGAPNDNFVGTSFSAPLMAGFTTIANQQASEWGYPPVGFVNPAIYSLASYQYTKYFHDINTGHSTTSYCSLGDSGACALSVYEALPGYDLTTGIGSPTCNLVDGLAVLQASPWQLITNSSLPCADEVAGAEMGPASAWAISCSLSGSGPDHTIWRLVSGTWEQQAGGARHVSVTPNGIPWVLNTNGTVFQLENAGAPCATWSSGCGWVPMNTYGASGPHNFLSSIAPGPSGTAWATSQAPYNGGSDFTIYYYAGGASGEGTWELMPGGGRQVAISGSNVPYLRNAAGTTFAYINGAWVATSTPSNDDVYTEWSGADWNGAAISIAAAAPPSNLMWMIANDPWESGSFDDTILQLVQSNNLADQAWVQLPGGGVQISVSPAGNPWVTNHAGQIFAAPATPAGHW